MNVSPSIVVGHFKLKDHYCADSTYWYSNLLDYMPNKAQFNPVPYATIEEELDLKADQTFSRTVKKADGKAEAQAGTYALLEQGPTKIMAVTKTPGEAKPVSDQQVHHRIELTFNDAASGQTQSASVDLVSSGYDQLVLVAQAPREACAGVDSLTKVYDRIKP